MCWNKINSFFPVALDVSADLTELGRTPVAVVCAGVKSILDIGRTLEYLETQGVTVASYGESRQFPAFFTPKSGFEAPYSVRDPLEAAKLIGKLFLELFVRYFWFGPCHTVDGAVLTLIETTRLLLHVCACHIMCTAICAGV